MGLRGNAPAAAPQRCVLRGRRVAAASNGSVVRCAKEGIHPKFFPEAKVFCNGVEVMACGGTKKEYIVDIWSGNHPFYQGQTKTVVMDDGRVSRFNKMYPDLADTVGAVATMASLKADAAASAAAGGAPAPAAAPSAAPAGKSGKPAPKAGGKAPPKPAPEAKK